ncbi:DUF4349 domain-containing protein [Nocardia callitridis]|uniref:DUF4349 domain-containing protein n=1 Tax=Nocardia callitridis TaxID=648753 RepID=A0ABP9L1K5_9NOCA
MRKLCAVLCIGLFGLTVLVGCGDDATEPTSTDVGSAEQAPAPALAPPGLRAQGQMKENNSDSTTVTDRKEVVTGSVDLTADDPIDVASTIVERVRTVQGRVDSRTDQPGVDDKDPSAQLTVRIPADKTDSFIDGLGGLARVTEVSTDRDDVTMRWEDLDARIKALQASVDRLRALIANAANTADLINAEQALSSRQGELDSLTAQKRRLDDQVALSTLTIDISSTANTPDAGPNNFWDGIVSGWHSLVDWLHDAVVFVGKAIPWVVFLVVIGAVVWGIARLTRRGRGNARGRHGPSKNTDSVKTTEKRADTGTSAQSGAAESESEASTPATSETSAEPGAHEFGGEADPGSTDPKGSGTERPDADN